MALDIDRDHYMTAAEARDYGIVDHIILPRRGLCAPGADDAATAGAVAAPELQVAAV